MLIVFDLEATCWDKEDKTPDKKIEIIQIGAVKIDLYAGLILDTFSSLVRPKHSKTLSQYCVDLTGITMDGLVTSEYFEQVYPKFVKFCGSRHKNTLVAWGAYDGLELEKSCRDNDLESKHPRHYINASLLFRERHKLPKKIGLSRAVEHCGLQFEGLQHDAFWDALNTARVFTHCFGVQLNNKTA